MKFDLKYTHLDTFWIGKLKNDGQFSKKEWNHSLMTSRIFVNYRSILGKIRFSIAIVNDHVIIFVFIIVDRNYFSWKIYQPSNL